MFFSLYQEYHQIWKFSFVCPLEIAYILCSLSSVNFLQSGRNKVRLLTFIHQKEKKIENKLFIIPLDALQFIFIRFNLSGQ